MRNFKVTLEYDGTGFNGWQIQLQGERTIQGEVQSVLSKIFKHKVNAVASGRTDAGVHALGQAVSFKARTKMSPTEIQRAMTSFLPADIVVREVQEVPLNFHAQHSARSKTYRYTILNCKIPSAKERNFCHFYPYKLDLLNMRREAKALVGKHDFKSFEASDPERKKHSSVRTIQSITITKKMDWIYIDITADGFLYKMVRNIVGVLLDAGCGRLAKDGVKAILVEKNRCKAGQTAEPQGLCLLEVKY